MKNKLVGAIGMAMAMCSASAFADPDPTRQPMDQAIERVGENIGRNPDNRGLQNAGTRLLENRARQATRGKNRAPGQQRLGLHDAGQRESLAGPERAQAPQRAERPDLPARPERPEVPARPERPERPERPDPPGQSRR